MQQSGSAKTYPEDENDLSTHRVCVYKNICLVVNNRFVYYENSNMEAPDFMKLSANLDPMEHLHSQSFLHGYFHGDKPRQVPLVVQRGPLPPHLAMASQDDVLFYQAQSQTYNFAHCLLEDLLPVLMTMDVFNLGSHARAKVVHNCAGGSYVNDSTKSDKIQSCARNLETYASLLDMEIYSFGASEEVCLPTLVMGHSMAFSQWHVDKHITRYLRLARDKIVSKFGFSQLKKPSAHRILVLTKGSFGFGAAASASDWPELCREVTAALEGGGGARVPIQCLEVSDNVKEISYALHRSSLVVSEHGTLASTSSLFGRDGTVHVVGCALESCKMNAVFTAAHIKYLFIHQLEDLLPTIQFALDSVIFS